MEILEAQIRSIGEAVKAFKLPAAENEFIPMERMASVWASIAADRRS